MDAGAGPDIGGMVVFDVAVSLGDGVTTLGLAVHVRGQSSFGQHLAMLMVKGFAGACWLTFRPRPLNPIFAAVAGESSDCSTRATVSILGFQRQGLLQLPSTIRWRFDEEEDVKLITEMLLLMIREE